MLGILHDSEVQELLAAGGVCRIGCRSGDQILILPIAFAYEDGCVWCHSFEGTKIQWMRAANHVGFEVDKIEDGQNWKCVVAQGIYEELRSAGDIEAAKRILNNRWKSDKSSLTALPPAENPAGPHIVPGPSVFFRVRLTDITGRFEQASASTTN